MHAVIQMSGLSEKESQVYMALLEIGEANASAISKKLHINRTHCYDILESLAAKGMVSHIIKNKKKYFAAANPQKIIESLENKKINLQEQIEQTKAILPQLIQLHTTTSQDTSAQIYSGIEGIKTIYDDILKNAKEYLVLGGTGKIADVLKYYFPHHETARLKKNVNIKILFNEKLRNQSITAREQAQMKFLPQEYSCPTPTLIYNDTVVIIIWTQPLAIVIKNKEVSTTYKKYFDMLWKISQS